MRLNQYIAHHTKYSRREADKLIESGRVNIEKSKASLQSVLQEGMSVFLINMAKELCQRSNLLALSIISKKVSL